MFCEQRRCHWRRCPREPEFDWSNRCAGKCSWSEDPPGDHAPKKTKLPKKRRSDRGDPMIIVQKALKLKVWFKTHSLSLSLCERPCLKKQKRWKSITLDHFFYLIIQAKIQKAQFKGQLHQNGRCWSDDHYIHHMKVSHICFLSKMVKLSSYHLFLESREAFELLFFSF